MQAEEKKAGAVPPVGAAAAGPAGKGGKEGSAYIAPALREGGNRRGETMAAGRRSKFYSNTIYLFYNEKNTETQNNYWLFTLNFINK